MGRASGNTENGAEIGMAYALMDLGREKIVAQVRRPGRASRLQRERAARLAGERRGRSAHGRRAGSPSRNWSGTRSRPNAVSRFRWAGSWNQVLPRHARDCPIPAPPAWPCRSVTSRSRCESRSGLAPSGRRKPPRTARRGAARLVRRRTRRARTGWASRTRPKACSCASARSRSCSSRCCPPIRRSAYARALLAAWVKKAAE